MKTNLAIEMSSGVKPGIEHRKFGAFVTCHKVRHQSKKPKQYS